MAKYLYINGEAFWLQQFHHDFILLKPKEERTSVASVGKAIFEARFSFAEEVIVTEAEICIKINKHFSALSILQLSQLKSKEYKQPKTIDLPIQFADSEDWCEICEHTKMRKDDLIKQILNASYTVAMLGFLPGFVYMNGLPTSCHVPRKSSPSNRVAAQSFAIGGGYLGLYSLPSPGGWHIVGHCPRPILDIEKMPPVDLGLGDEVRLVPM